MLLQTLSEQFWTQTRENYASLTQLAGTLNHYISHIVLLSFASNLYFICLQLLNSLK
jgi:gustatory receptor